MAVQIQMSLLVLLHFVDILFQIVDLALYAHLLLDFAVVLFDLVGDLPHVFL